MMSVHAVMVRTGLGFRWIDSLWVSKASAEDRAAILYCGFKNFNIDAHAWAFAMRLEDGDLKPPAQQSDKENPSAHQSDKKRKPKAAALSHEKERTDPA